MKPNHNFTGMLSYISQDHERFANTRNYDSESYNLKIEQKQLTTFVIHEFCEVFESKTGWCIFSQFLFKKSKLS